MGSLGPTVLIGLLLAVATIAAIAGFVASAVARSKKRRAHRLFLVGFFCGLMAGAILHGRRRGLNALRRDTVRFAARALNFATSHNRLGLLVRRSEARPWQRSAAP